MHVTISVHSLTPTPKRLAADIEGTTKLSHLQFWRQRRTKTVDSLGLRASFGKNRAG